MEAFRYQLIFDTSLNPAGANAAENAIRRVDDAASRVTRSSSSNDESLRRSLQDSAAKARVSEFAFYDLDAAVNRTSQSGAKFAAGTGQISRGSDNASRSLLLFSQGFEDAQYGIRGVLNNIPGLIIAMGGTAGLAGAISIAAVSASVLFSWLNKTEESASKFEEKLKEVGEKAGEIKSDKIALMTQSLWDAWDAADATRQGFEETKKASDSFSVAALSNAEKVRQAETLIAEVLGLQVNHWKTLEEQAERASQQRQLAAQQAIRQQQEEIAAAQLAVEIAEKKLETAKQDQAANLADLETEKAKLAILETQHQLLMQQSKQTVGWGEALAQGYGIPGITPNETATKAKETMKTPGYTSELESVRARVEALESAVGEPDAELNRTVVKMENQLLAAQTTATDKFSAAQIKIQELQSTLDADTTLADAQLAVDKSKAMADSLKEVLSSITAGTDDQITAKAAAEKAVSDGKITANELADLNRNLSTLIGGLQSGLSASTENTALLVNQMRTFQSDQAVLAREIDALKKSYETIKRK